MQSKNKKPDSKKIHQRNKILTQFYNENLEVLKGKVLGICINHGIPIQADIQSDVLMVAFEHLCKVNPDTIIEIYNDNPKRLLGLFVRVAVRNGVLPDNRSRKFWYKAIALDIVNQSTLNTLNHISSTEHEDDYSLILEDEDCSYEAGAENMDMWDFVKEQLQPEEIEILDILLTNKKPKLKAKQKPLFEPLLGKLKGLITDYKTKYEDE